MTSESVIDDAALLVAGYRGPWRLKRKISYQYEDVGGLRNLCAHLRAQVQTANPTIDWHDRYSWFLIIDVMTAVDDDDDPPRRDLLVAKHMLACGGPYPDSFRVPAKLKSGPPYTLGEVRKQFRPNGLSYDNDLQLRRLFCAQIIGGESNIFRRREPNPGGAARELLSELEAAINAPGYIAERIDGYAQRLNDETRRAAAANPLSEQKPQNSGASDSDRVRDEARQHSTLSGLA